MKNRSFPEFKSSSQNLMAPIDLFEEQGLLRHTGNAISFADRVSHVKLLNNTILAMGPKHAQVFALEQ
ncbi:MAG TPA: hypothetical protein ENI62_03700 [Gammaproteobacteria bacterium]|nr:hypothetical protein [Gammaproteobacteria bacterium]